MVNLNRVHHLRLSKTRWEGSLPRLISILLNSFGPCRISCHRLRIVVRMMSGLGRFRGVVGLLLIWQRWCRGLGVGTEKGRRRRWMERGASWSRLLGGDLMELYVFPFNVDQDFGTDAPRRPLHLVSSSTADMESELQLTKQV